jgi:hypothetical protein
MSAPSGGAQPPPAGADTMSPSLHRARNYYAWILERLGPFLGAASSTSGAATAPCSTGSWTARAP